jgi:hypothetical protein
MKLKLPPHIPARAAALAVLLFLPAAASAQTPPVTILDATNGETDITAGSLYDFQIINVGMTAYYGVPYIGGNVFADGTVPHAVEFTSYLLGVGAPGTYSVNFYTGDPATGAPTAMSGFTAGTGSAISGGSGAATDNPGAEVTTLISYTGGALDPFTSTTGGMLWIGITNTGGTDLGLYVGGINTVDIPAPLYSAASPLATAANSTLNPNSYFYFNGTVNPAYPGNTGVLPYIDLVVIPEPSAAALLLGAFGSLILLRRRR